MKTIKYIAVVFVLVSVAVATFADSLTVVPDSVVTLTTDSVVTAPVEHSVWKDVFTMENILVIFVGLYEIVIRVYPTAKNYSLLSYAYKFISWFLPNNKKLGGKHE